MHVEMSPKSKHDSLLLMFYHYSFAAAKFKANILINRRRGKVSPMSEVKSRKNEIIAKQFGSGFMKTGVLFLFFFFYFFFLE